MKAGLLATLSLLVASSAPAQLPYTEKQVIAYAKSIDVKTLDPSLPSQHLEDWLQSGPPHAHILFWEMDATCDLKPDDPSEDYPLCAEVRVTHDGQFGFILVQVGTLKRGIVGPPSIHRGVGVEETWEIMTGSSERLSDIPGLLNQPAFTGGVRQLYEEIVVHHPIGIPPGAEMAAIRPFLSKRLAEQLQTAKACQEDYFQQHQIIKGAPKPTWLKMGIFSGDGKRALPVESYPSLKERPTDGTFLVDVSLSLPDINGHKPKSYSRNDWWVVAVKVISENGQFVVDDVRIFDGLSTDGPSHLLSDSFAGCDGSHWTGLATTEK
jgi:hypothetical protein